MWMSSQLGPEFRKINSLQTSVKQIAGAQRRSNFSCARHLVEKMAILAAHLLITIRTSKNSHHSCHN